MDSAQRGAACILWQGDRHHRWGTVDFSKASGLAVTYGRLSMPSGFRFVSRREEVCSGAVRLCAPHGLEIIRGCLSCPHREDPFSATSPPEVQKLAAITSAFLSQRSDAFRWGRYRAACSSCAAVETKLSTTSADGKR